MKKYLPLIFMCISILVIQIIYWLVVSANIPSDQQGTFGDTFGGVTSLFSGFAFAGMFYAITMQSKELELQREELALTRAELKTSNEQQSKSTEAQQNLVEKQILASHIQGMAAIVQGRYQYAGTLNSKKALEPTLEVEKKLIELLNKAGMEDFVLPRPV